MEKKTTYCYNDITIVPAAISHISSRKECNPFYQDGMLPLFAAPMDSVVCLENYDTYIKNSITPILPRNIDFGTRIGYAVSGKWAAFSLGEFVEHFTKRENKLDNLPNKIRALIDVANGHMKAIYDAVSDSKRIYGSNIEVMVGNIANPETYRHVFESGADYVRCSIGSGSCCITSSNTAVHYGTATLIEEIRELKERLSQENGVPMEKMPKIIADGGIRNYSDVNKALALGADYVMVGGLFATFVESGGSLFYGNGAEVSYLPSDIIVSDGVCRLKHDLGDINLGVLYKRIYGMASRKGQASISGCSMKTAEGIEREIVIKYNMRSWVENMKDYLKSAMSYTDSKTLEDFIGKAETVIVSNNTYHSVNK